MYSSPQIVLGFHGCDQKIADSVIKKGGTLNQSENKYDWLGHGIYFWEGDVSRAQEWAEGNRKVNTPTVVGAIIKLGNCLDLLDTEHTQKIKEVYEILERETNAVGEALPTNRKIDTNGFPYARDLDCRVIMRLHKANNDEISKELNINENDPEKNVKIQKHFRFIDSVRGMFPEGDQLYPNAGFREKNHVQLCVVNPNCIIGYFNPKPNDKNFKKLW